MGLREKVDDVCACVCVCCTCVKNCPVAFRARQAAAVSLPRLCFRKKKVLPISYRSVLFLSFISNNEHRSTSLSCLKKRFLGISHLLFLP